MQGQSPVPSRCDKERTNEPQLFLTCLVRGGRCGGLHTTAGGRGGTQSQSNEGEVVGEGRERERAREKCAAI